MIRPLFFLLASRVPGRDRVAGILAAAMLTVTACAPFSPSGPGRIPPQIKYWAAPTVLPGIRPEMKTCGFWIEKITAPDRILLDEKEIEALNRDIQDRLGLAKKIARLPETLDRQILTTELTHWLSRFRDQGPFFEKDGQRAPPIFFKKIERQMNLAALPPRIPLRFGLITTNTDQHLLPTRPPLFAEAGDLEFNRLQNNALDTGTPVAVLHQSLNARWGLCLGALQQRLDPCGTHRLLPPNHAGRAGKSPLCHRAQGQGQPLPEQSAYPV